MNELLTSAEMARADALAIAGGIAGGTLMEAAGRAVARIALAHLRGAGRVCVLAGPGNNGGDGFVAARLLAEHGLAVTLALAGERSRLNGDAAAAAAGLYRGAVLRLADAPIERSDLIIDALFGAGLSKPVAGEAAAAIARVNASRATVVAVDVPSGVDGTTGAVRGAAVEADHTVTFFRAKPGHFLYPGRGHCGVLHVEDIGIPDAVLGAVEAHAFVNGHALWGRAVRPAPPDGHKYSRGHVLAVSGGPCNTGAIRLAAGAALRAGAGLVTIAAGEAALPVHAAHLTAVMLRHCEDAAALAGILTDRRFTAVVLGPALGVGALARELTLAALASNAATIIDADALMSFAEAPDVLFGAIAAAPGRPAVLTPHEGEFARLFPAIAPEVSKLERAREAARLSGATIILKGADSVVAMPDGRAAINADAPSWLATAGSGDVLAGIIAAFAGQGVPAFEAVCAAVTLHAHAARRAGPGMIAEDIAAHLPFAIGETVYSSRL